MDPTRPETVTCPTCRATQAWSDACRRCKCDLRLLREADEDYRRSRARCLLALRAGLPGEARRLARRCHRLRADAESLRLLALGALLDGDWAAADALARDLPGPG